MRAQPPPPLRLTATGLRTFDWRERLSDVLRPLMGLDVIDLFVEF